MEERLPGHITRRYLELKAQYYASGAFDQALRYVVRAAEKGYTEALKASTLTYEQDLRDMVQLATDIEEYNNRE